VVNQEGVAIIGSFGYSTGSYRATSTGFIFYHYRLAERLGHGCSQGTGHNVGGATGGERDNQANRLGRIALGKNGARGQNQCAGDCSQSGFSEISAWEGHGLSPWLLSMVEWK
jgi:hypothetical protein